MSEEELWADDLVREHHAKERTFGWKSKDDDEEGLFPEARTVSKSNVAPQIRQSLSNSNRHSALDATTHTSTRHTKCSCSTSEGCAACSNKSTKASSLFIYS